MYSSQEYRDDARWAIRVFWEPKHDGLLIGDERVGTLKLRDLEALHEEVTGVKPHKPARYQPRH
jgi:hypothetical protein